MRACTQQALLVPTWPESIPTPDPATPSPPFGCVNPHWFLFRPDSRDPSTLPISLHPSLVPSSCQQKRCGPWPWVPPKPPPWLRSSRSWQSGAASAGALSKNISPSHPGPSWPFRSSLSYCSVHFSPACELPGSSLFTGFSIPAVENQHPGDPVWGPWSDLSWCRTGCDEITHTDQGCLFCKYAPNPLQTAEEDRPAWSILGAEHPALVFNVYPVLWRPSLSQVPVVPTFSPDVSSGT